MTFFLSNQSYHRGILDADHDKSRLGLKGLQEDNVRPVSIIFPPFYGSVQRTKARGKLCMTAEDWTHSFHSSPAKITRSCWPQ